MPWDSFLKDFGFAHPQPKTDPVRELDRVVGQDVEEELTARGEFLGAAVVRAIDARARFLVTIFICAKLPGRQPVLEESGLGRSHVHSAVIEWGELGAVGRREAMDAPVAGGEAQGVGQGPVVEIATGLEESPDLAGGVIDRVVQDEAALSHPADRGHLSVLLVVLAGLVVGLLLSLNPLFGIGTGLLGELPEGLAKTVFFG